MALSQRANRAITGRNFQAFVHRNNKKPRHQRGFQRIYKGDILSIHLASHLCYYLFRNVIRSRRIV